MLRNENWLILKIWCLLLMLTGWPSLAEKSSIENAMCRVWHFKCANGVCIPSSWRCDGDNDCGDGSDEIPSNCTSSLCKEEEFRCTNGRCIPRHWQCDGESDCPDSSDENPSLCKARECNTSEMFQCETGECIPKTWVCDENNDCPDGSDEKHCGNLTCRADEFTCQNKHCIKRYWVCDHDDDCGDNSDEKDCPSTTCEPDTEFTCSQNGCISSRWRCDGDLDCSDGSDEVGCTVPPSGQNLDRCAAYEFPCGDGITCIPRGWICDGDDDCPDKSDESTSTCNSSICTSDQFQCLNRSCIPGHSKCNGIIDCADGSDERNCTTTRVVCDPVKEFDCGHGSCIPLSSVCDSKPDCLGREDEPPHLCGRNECLIENGGCSHICIDFPIGFKCECRNGFKLINNQTCEDIDECMEPGSCSQLCQNHKGGFKCDCVNGYQTDPEDLTRCKATQGNASLLFTRRQDIRELALDHQEMRTIVNTKMAIALDFIFRTGMIFWSDIDDKKIYKAPVDNGIDRTVVIDGVRSSEGLAVDWIYNNIYWTDDGKKTIEMANLEGTMRKSLITDDLQKPRAIALDPLEGWIFWTDWGEDARIERAGMDGSHRLIIVETELEWPNGLTLDLVDNKLYWVDAKLSYIASCNYDGSGRHTVLNSPQFLTHPFGITTFEDQIYWTDWDKDTIFKANKFTGKDIEALIAPNNLPHLVNIHVYHPLRQSDGKNHCQSDNGNCSHICLPAPKINSSSPLITCACPDGLRLLPNELTCVENVTITIDLPTTEVVTERFIPFEPPENQTEIIKIGGSPGQETCHCDCKGLKDLRIDLQIEELQRALKAAEERATLYKSQLETNAEAVPSNPIPSAKPTPGISQGGILMSKVNTRAITDGSRNDLNYASASELQGKMKKSTGGLSGLKRSLQNHIEDAREQNLLKIQKLSQDLKAAQQQVADIQQSLAFAKEQEKQYKQQLEADCIQPKRARNPGGIAWLVVNPESR